MNVHDQLEERAERGIKRGAAAVWSGAQHRAPQGQPADWRWSAVVQRAALVLCILGVAGLLLMRTTFAKSTESAGDAASESEVETIGVDEAPDAPLPAPILVVGGTLKRDHGGVARPADPNFDGDDLLDDIFGTQWSEIPEESAETNASFVVFADPVEPFRNPILGLEVLEGGGFRPWGLNLSNLELTDLTKNLEQVDGQWLTTSTSSLVEVARFEDDHMNSIRFGWQFDFDLEGDAELTIQAEAMPASVAADEWVWIARLAGSGQPAETTRPIRVLGRDGVVLERAAPGQQDGNAGSADVVWVADGFVYRMTASRIEGNTSYSRDPIGEVERLKLVSRSQWLDAIAVSGERTGTDTVVGLFWLLLALSLPGSAVFFIVQRSMLAAASVLVILPVWFALGTSPNGLLDLVPLALGLGLAWWLHRRAPQLGNTVPALRGNPGPVD